MRRAALIVLALLLLAGAGVAGAGAVSSDTLSSQRLAANKAAAHRDAPALITRLRLPVGAVQTTSQPKNRTRWLRPMPVLQESFAAAVAHTWWTVPGDPQSVIAAVEQHPPVGSRPYGSGSGSSPQGSELDVEYSWPSVSGVLGSRLLQITVTSLGHGMSGVLAEAQSDWIVPRPTSERIPATARVIEIDSRVPGAADGGQVTVTRAGQATSIVSIVNRLPIVQPGATACPVLRDPRLITMTFRAHADGPALAVLRFADYRPWRIADSGECEPVQLSIAGHRGRALDGGRFMHHIEHLLGLRLT